MIKESDSELELSLFESRARIEKEKIRILKQEIAQNYNIIKLCNKELEWAENNIKEVKKRMEEEQCK